ncbi:MAG: hypothetical protein IIA73_06205 [Proteobacteria bacterium]|nr:hypothetical protein [Pseudomonadota bacterium]
MTHSVLPVTPEELEILKAVEKKVLWLSTYMIHYANHIRPNPDSIKVGGHQASSSSIVSLLTALMLRTMSALDRLALKPHASPVFHAVQYLLGNLDKEKLSQFRQFGGIQSYPSRRKDHDGVHFNTGSVGIGGANVIFSAIVQEYAMRHFPREQAPGKYISLMGDAEMEEGTLYEALLEGQNYNLNNCWWIIDLNRQSLDKLLAANRGDRGLYNLRQRFGGGADNFDVTWHSTGFDNAIRPNLVVFTAERATSPFPGPVQPLPETVFPAALRITIDLVDDQKRMARPTRHVMIIPVGG